MNAMSREEYESILIDLEWMKTNCPERVALINFTERFVDYIKSVYREHQEDYNAAFNR